MARAWCAGCVTVCYCVLQCVTVCYSVLLRVAVACSVLCVLQCVTVCYCVLQFVTACYSVLLRVTVACSVGTFYEAASGSCRTCWVCYSVLQRVTVCYSGLQRGHVLRGCQWHVQGVPVCYSVLQRVTVCYSGLQCGHVLRGDQWLVLGVLQCVTVCYSVLLCVTVACSVGTFYEAASGSCRACRAGSYQNREGKLRCKTCGTDALTGPPGAASRKQCTGEGGGGVLVTVS